jgi:threonine dehydratase
MEITLQDIKNAQKRFNGKLQPSPLIFSGYFSRMLGAEVFLKLENLQETGSFKVRGAFNRLLQLSSLEKKKGVIAASAGNHAQGVAWASARLGIQATIVMPEDVSLRKLLAVQDYGAEVILHGKYYNEAASHARQASRETGKILIPAFDDPQVIAGQGTIGLEIADSLGSDATVVVPIGGGGLIAGVSLAVKAHHSRTRIVGVQANSSPSTIRSLEQAARVSVQVGPTLADGIAVNRPGEITFPIIRDYVDEVVGVEEEAVAGAILNLLDKANVIAEGAGAVPLAALMDNQVSVKVKRYILIVSGGNIEINTIDRILQRGSIKMGRLIRIEVNVQDIPGALWKLLAIIAKQKANILHIFHDRLDLQNPLEVSRVRLSLETRGHDHARQLVERLQNAGYQVRRTL